MKLLWKRVSYQKRKENKYSLLKTHKKRYKRQQDTNLTSFDLWSVNKRGHSHLWTDHPNKH